MTLSSRKSRRSSLLSSATEVTYARLPIAVTALALAGCLSQDPAPVEIVDEGRDTRGEYIDRDVAGTRGEYIDEAPVVEIPLDEEPVEVVAAPLEVGTESGLTAASPVEITESNPSDPTADEQVIGLLLPLGDRRHQSLAEALRSAAVLAVEEANDSLLRLSVHDTVPDPLQAAREALDAGARILVGPLFAEEVRRVRTLADVRGVNIISFSTDVGVARENVFIAGSLPQLETHRVLRYAISQGHRRFAAILPRTEYGQVVRDTIDRVMEEQGTEMVMRFEYSEGFESTRDATRRFVEEYQGIREFYPTQAPTALLLPAADNDLKTMAAYLVDSRVELDALQLLGTGLWDSQETLNLERREGLAAITGGWFAAPSARFRRAFDQRFQDRFGYRPPNLAAIAFDATIAAVVVAEDGFSTAAITDPKGFLGVTGTFRFRNNGTIERRLAILEVGNGAFQVIEAADKDTLEY